MVYIFQGVCCTCIVYQMLKELDLLIGLEKITSFTGLNELNLKYDPLKKKSDSAPFTCQNSLSKFKRLTKMELCKIRLLVTFHHVRLLKTFGIASNGNRLHPRNVPHAYYYKWRPASPRSSFKWPHRLLLAVM